MQKFKLFVLLLLIFSFGLKLNALTPEEILGIVGNNPTIQVMEKESDYDVLIQQSANSLSAPEIDFEHLWGKGGERKWSLGITQNFEWPGIYSIRKKIIHQNQITNKYKVDAARLEIKLQAAQLLVKLMYNQKRLEMLHDMITDMEEINKNLDHVLDFGQITILDKKKANIETTTLKIECDNLYQNQLALKAELEKLTVTKVNFDEIEWIMPYAFTLNNFDSYISDIDKDPTLLAYTSINKSAMLSREESTNSSLPGFGVGYRHEKEEGIHFNGFSLSLNLPNWNTNKKRKAAETFISAKHTDIEAHKTLLYTRIETEYDRARTLRTNLVELHNGGLDGTYLSLMKEAYQGGELSLLDYIREQSYYRSVNIEMLALQEAYAELLVSLNRYQL